MLEVQLVTDNLSWGKSIRDDLQSKNLLVNLGRLPQNIGTDWIETPPQVVIIDLVTNYLQPEQLPNLRFVNRLSRAEAPVYKIALAPLGKIKTRIDLINIGFDFLVDYPGNLAPLKSKLRNIYNLIEITRSMQHIPEGFTLQALEEKLEKERVVLSAAEKRIFQLFVTNQHRVIKKSEIYAVLKQGRAQIDSNLPNVYLNRLRKKVYNALGRCFVFIPGGYGYKLGLTN